MSQDNNFERLQEGGTEIVDDGMPSAEDLGDLFNFEFNKPNSYRGYSNPIYDSVNFYNNKQSIHLFINKFGSIDGLI